MATDDFDEGTVTDSIVEMLALLDAEDLAEHQANHAATRFARCPWCQAEVRKMKRELVEEGPRFRPRFIPLTGE